MRFSVNHTSTALPANISVTAYNLMNAPTSITAPDNTAVKRTPILSRMIPAMMRKNTKTFKNVSEPCIVPNAVESQPCSESMRSLIGDRMSIKMYEQNIAKERSNSAVHLIAALSLNTLIFSVIL